MMDAINEYLANPAGAGVAARSVAVGLLVVISVAAYLLARWLICGLIRRLLSKRPEAWSDVLMNMRLLRTLSRMVPVMIVHRGASAVLEGADAATRGVERLSMAVLIVLALVAVSNLLNSADRIYNRHPMARARPIKGVLQLLCIFLYSIGAVLILAILLDKPAWGFVSGIGALSAVLLLVFKDTLLGVAASFQIGANKMVAIGDWIEMPKYNADGDVIDISLQTVKVRNWDKTVTTIPIYALVADSFKNWRGMTESGGRRIMRSICIDMNSIRFCDAAMIERFRKIRYLSEYLETKTREIERYNREHEIDDEVTVNGRRMTNIGTFRAYVVNYLQRHPGLRQDMTMMVRQLDPGPQGLPLQVWAFTKTTAWVEYEGVQSDIFDHLLSVLSEFDLRPFQVPSGWDMERIGGRVALVPVEDSRAG